MKGHAMKGHGILIHQRCLSLLGSKRESVAKLLPTAERATGWLEFGTAFGMMRYAPSGSCSMRQSCSGAPVKDGSTTSSESAVAASARSVPAMVILKYGAPG